jgi:hypothetical protein
MIVSHKHRYVYVEVPRTGSTAISRELRDEYDGTPILRKHATYRDFLRQASEDERRYFVFSGIRNPLDIAVTRFAHMKVNAKGHFTNPEDVAVRNSIAGRIERRIFRWVHDNDADFESFLLRWYRVPYDTWTSLDHKRMDKVIRFESLADDFNDALRRIGITPTRPLPVHNATPGRDRDFVASYTPRAIKRAVWVFGPYMEEWGYSFPESWGKVRVPRSAKLMMRILRVFRGIYWKHLRFADYTRRRPGGMLGNPRPATATRAPAEERTV